MNKTGSGNYLKLIAFFLVAALLIVGFGFATEGWWQSDENGTPDNITDNNGNTILDESPTIKDDTPTTSEPEIKLPEFVNIITGLETTEELSRKRHYAFVLDPTSPMYAISGSDIIAEFPIENGDTRLLAFTNNITTLSKIGSLIPTRSYISNVAKFFGSVLISNGNDGSISYDGCDMNGSIFDLSSHPGYYYTEYVQFTYTNGDLIDAGIYNANVNTTASSDLSLPYIFTDFGKNATAGNINAKTVIIPYSSKSETELYYSQDTSTYSFNKNGVSKNDMLSDKKISYKNIFIIFTDTLTYEGKENTEMVMNTIGEGTGYYISHGTAQNIKWKSDASGNMTFFDLNGQKLTVNRGNAYISFAKSSKYDDVKIS